MSQAQQVDYTVRVFDQFYNLDLVVNADQYEVVLSFFRKYSSTEQIAKGFTDALFRVSNITQISVMELLQSFDPQDKIKVQLTMAYYLNSISDSTLLYGVNQIRIPNQAVARNIVQ
jgi:hypothetical protein